MAKLIRNDRADDTSWWCVCIVCACASFRLGVVFRLFDDSSFWGYDHRMGDE